MHSEESITHFALHLEPTPNGYGMVTFPHFSGQLVFDKDPPATVRHSQRESNKGKPHSFF